MTGTSGALSIRWRTDGDDEALYAIDKRATRLFVDHGMPKLADNGPPFDRFQAFLRGHDCFVAELDGRHAGFAVCGEQAGAYWLRELGVDPAFQRQGIGTALVNEVVARARWAFHSAVGLTTFRHLPFNQPFYERLGFIAAPSVSLPTHLRSVLEAETPPGTSVDTRVLMTRRL